MNSGMPFLMLRSKINDLEPQAREVFFSFVCTEKEIDDLGKDDVESFLVSLSKILGERYECPPCVSTTGKLVNSELAQYHFIMSFLDEKERDEIEERIKATGAKTLSMMPRQVFDAIISEYPPPIFANSDVGVPATVPLNPTMPTEQDFKKGDRKVIPLQQYNTLVDPDNIPRTLMTHVSWCNWTFTAKLGNDGVAKSQKIPTNTRTGRFLRKDEMKDLAIYSDAVNYLWNNKGKVSGVDYVLSDERTGVIGIDVDNCIKREGGNVYLSDLALRVLSAFCDTYCEVSPSGEGIRIFCLGKLPPKENRLVKFDYPDEQFPDQIIEMYDHSSLKPFTMTGARFEFGGDGDVHFMDHSLLWLLNEFFAKPQRDNQPTEHKPPIQKERAQGSSQFDDSAPFTDDDILAILSKAANASKFQDLYDGGLGGKSDTSKADAAFCFILSFYTQSSRGGGANQIDSIFRRSRRMRKKWDEVHYANGDTYGVRLINEAARGNNMVYKSRQERG